MIKPGLPYLDIVSYANEKFGMYPIAVYYTFLIFSYQVSGEYSMIWYGAENELFSLKDGVMESVDCMKRAGL